MRMNIEIAFIIFEICIVPEPSTTSGTGLLLDRDRERNDNEGRQKRRLRQCDRFSQCSYSWHAIM